MKISYNWLKEWVELPWTPEQTAERLAELGFPVDETHSIGVQAQGVIAVKILKVDKHPNADRLRLATITDGKQEKTIVCGAPNIAPGQVVPLAQPGADLPGGVKITVSKIRGIESAGMLCSARELGLSQEHEGIYLLADNTPLGTDVRSVFGSDTVFDVDVTPNRPDALSHVGIARELAAYAGLPMKSLTFTAPAPKGSEECRVRNDEPSLCRRYTGRLVSGILVRPSPEWMVSRLAACGIRAINNIVDITNYVLLEWGHPLHAFDLDKLAGRQIVVRRAKAAEKILALDGKTYELQTSDLVIADEKNPVAVAGIMGGELSGVTEKTRNILLESAVFDQTTVRKTSRRLGLKSESSIRFEKGTHPDTAVKASLRALQLILELAGGTAGATADAYPAPAAPREIRLRLERLETIAGREFSAEDVNGTLFRLGFAPQAEKGAWRCTVPSYRLDVQEEADVIEEVTRLTGYNAIPVRSPQVSVGEMTPELAARDTSAIVDILLGAGVSETMSSSFCENDLAARFLPERGELVRLANPLSKEEAVLRPSIVPNLMRALKKNANLQRSSVLLFEIGNRFVGSPEGGRPKESAALAIAAAGDVTPKSCWGPARPADFFFLKGLVELLDRTLSRGFSFNFGSSRPYLHPKQSFTLLRHGKAVGWGGVLHPAFAAELDVKSAVTAEIDLDALLAPGKKRSFAAPAKYPWVERDIAVVLDRSRGWAEIEAEALKSGGELVKDVRPFDLFEGDAVGAGRKSLAFRVRLQHPEHTLSEAEINGAVERIKAALRDRCGAQLR